MADIPVPDERSSGRTLVLVGAMLAIAVMLAVPIRSWFAQRSTLDGLRADIAAAQSRVDELSAGQQRWQDPTYVAGQARLRLNMVLPGEAALIALNHDDPAAAEQEQAVPTTWYGRVWESAKAAGQEPVDATDPAEIDAP